MRVDRLRLRNFKCFEDYTLELHPRFTLLVGDNGAGKTTILDALAVAAGIWLVKPPDSMLVTSGRNILRNEIRLDIRYEGDRAQFVECKPVSITATGEISGHRLEWRRQIHLHGSRTTNAGAATALRIVENHFSRDGAGKNLPNPVIAYYGAGRAWLPSRARGPTGRRARRPARRWEAFYDCFQERIRSGDLRIWFQREAIASANRGGHWRPGYEVVKGAIVRCVPNADDLWYDGDRQEIVLSIAGRAQPFANLSAGQRMMVALVADVATKAVMQNPHLMSDVGRGDSEVPPVLQQTPGMVLIDEIDVHLHPKWQREVVRDLKETFPKIQFIGTSHSPFIIQSLEAGELRTLDPGGPQLLEYANRSIEDIAEEVQRIDVPQQSLQARELAEATERYFSLLQGDADHTDEALQEAEAAYRAVAARYSASPGLSAILKLEALARKRAGRK